jgi:hypothetical protein
MTRIGRGLSFVVALCILFTARLGAQATYTAASCGQSAVQTAINSEQAHPVDGDVISIPAGSCSWSGTISQDFSKSVTVQGAGATSSTTGGAGTSGSDVTAITENGTVFSLTQIAGKSLRVTGIAFLQTSGSGTSLQLSGASTAVRLDHCHFHLYYAGVLITGSLQGVADHDYFDSPASLGGTPTNDFQIHNGETWNGATDGLGDASWTDKDHWGTSEFFFIEDSRFFDSDPSDSHDGARFVFRHNTVTGDGSGSAQQMYNHSLVSGSPGRAPRAVEVYDNTFTQAGNESNGPFSLNGGTLLFWGNTITGGYGYGVAVDYARAEGGFASPPNDWGNCGSSGGVGWDGKALPNGYPCMDQPGRGQGDLVAGANFPTLCSQTAGCPTYNGSWVHEILDPFYAWANTFTPQYYTSNPLIGVFPASLVVDNRDYYQQFGTLEESGSWNGTKGVNQSSSAPSGNCTAGTDPMTGGPAPGVGWWDTSNNTLYVCTATNTWTVYYTPYTYPHPLTQSSVGTGGAPAPPMGLAATVQ